MTSSAEERPKSRPNFSSSFRKWSKLFRESLMFFIPLDVPKPVQLAFGVLNVVFVLVILVCLFYFGFTSVINTVYLSPLSGSTASKNCELISQTNSGEYLATQNGTWEGSSQFTYSLATYRFSIASYTVSQQGYQEKMSRIFAGLVQYGGVMQRSNLANNLMMWMSLVFVDRDESAQRFTLVGTPETVFRRQFFDADIGTRNGRCNATSVTSFLRSTATVRTTYKIADFLADPYCTGALNPNLFGYNYRLKPEDFTIEFDMRTMVTAAAINYGLLSIASLVMIPGAAVSVSVGGTVVSLSSYYDPKYPGMSPIFCSARGSFSPTGICLMFVGDNTVFPFLMHSGKNSTYPEACDCATLTASELLNPAHLCHAFDFEAGFVFWNVRSPRPYFEFSQFLNSTSNYLDKAFYAAALSMQYWSKQESFQNDIRNSTFRRKAFEFCHVASGGYCSIYVLHAYDLRTAFRGYTVSPDYFQLTMGACRDSISTSPSAWQQLIDEPFAPIVQKYQECKYAISYAIQNEAGAALGNMSLFTPACMLVIYLLILCYKRSGLYHPPVHHSYSRDDKQEALEALAIALLMVRDGKFQSRKSVFLDKEKNREIEKRRNSKTDSMVGHVDTTTPVPSDDHSAAGSSHDAQLLAALAQQRSSRRLSLSARPSLDESHRPSELLQNQHSMRGITHHGSLSPSPAGVSPRHSARLPSPLPLNRVGDLQAMHNAFPSSRSSLRMSIGGGNEGPPFLFGMPPALYPPEQTRSRSNSNATDTPHGYGGSHANNSHRATSRHGNHHQHPLQLIQGIIDELKLHATLSAQYNDDEALGFLHKRLVMIDGEEVLIEDYDDLYQDDTHYDNWDFRSDNTPLPGPPTTSPSQPSSPHRNNVSNISITNGRKGVDHVNLHSHSSLIEEPPADNSTDLFPRIASKNSHLHRTTTGNSDSNGSIDKSLSRSNHGSGKVADPATSLDLESQQIQPQHIQPPASSAVPSAALLEVADEEADSGSDLACMDDDPLLLDDGPHPSERDLRRSIGAMLLTLPSRDENDV